VSALLDGLGLLLMFGVFFVAPCLWVMWRETR
jgi:hypothetical protein